MKSIFEVELHRIDNTTANRPVQNRPTNWLERRLAYCGYASPESVGSAARRDIPVLANNFPKWLADDLVYLLSNARLFGTDLAHCITSVNSPELAKLIAPTIRRTQKDHWQFPVSRSVDDLASGKALVDALSSELSRKKPELTPPAKGLSEYATRTSIAQQ